MYCTPYRYCQDFSPLTGPIKTDSAFTAAGVVSGRIVAAGSGPDCHLGLHRNLLIIIAERMSINHVLEGVMLGDAMRFVTDCTV